MDEMKKAMVPLESDLRDAKRRVSNVKGPARKRKGPAAAAKPATAASDDGDDADEIESHPGDDGSGDD